MPLLSAPPLPRECGSTCTTRPPTHGRHHSPLLFSVGALDHLAGADLHAVPALPAVQDDIKITVVHTMDHLLGAFDRQVCVLRPAAATARKHTAEHSAAGICRGPLDATHRCQRRLTMAHPSNLTSAAALRLHRLPLHAGGHQGPVGNHVSPIPRFPYCRATAHTCSLPCGFNWLQVPPGCAEGLLPSKTHFLAHTPLLCMLPLLLQGARCA